MLHYFEEVEKTSNSELPGLTGREKEWAMKAVRRTMKNSEKRGKYNDYSPELRAKIHVYK